MAEASIYICQNTTRGEEYKMGKVDLINGLIYRIEMNQYRVKNKKATAKLLKELQKNMKEILMEDNDEEFFTTFEKMISSSKVEPYITNNTIISKIGDVCENIVGFSSEYRYEIRWMIKCIASAKDIINDFVILREQYDNNILLNQYDEALKFVREIESKYGVSYWSVECKSFLKNHIDDYDEDLLRDLPENVYGSAVYFLEFMNRESITSDEYFYLIKKNIDEARGYQGNNRFGVEFLYYIASGNSYEFSEENLIHVIKILQHCSIIDRYLFIIRVADEVVASENSTLHALITQYIGVLSDIEDDHLKALIFTYCNEKLEEKNYVLKSRLNEAKSALVKGDLHKSRDQVIGLLKEFPNNTEAMKLIAEICILQEDNVNLFEETNLGKIIKCLCSVYSLDENRDDCIEEISKLTLLCSMSSWSRHLINEVLSRNYNPDSEEYKHCLTIANLQHLNIETVLAVKEKQECIDFIKSNYSIDEEYVTFKIAELEGNYKRASDMCNIAPWKEYLYICDEHSIEKKMEHLLPIAGKNAAFAVKSIIRFLNDIDIDRFAKVILKKSAELIIENIYTGLLLPWDKLITYIDDGPAEIRKEIYVPILYYVYAYYVMKSRYDDLGIVCDDFFRFNGIDRPSKMELFSGEYEQRMLVYFLKNVCVAKTLDDALDIFENTQERDKERVEICNLLTHIDSTNRVEYENEIREITQKLMINKELTIIDESRIHVNSEGIKEKLCNASGGSPRFGSSIKNDYQRYLFYREERAQQFLRVIKGEGEERFHEIGEIAHRLLTEMILKIRDAFVSSDEYGLNGYLSLNIRHNTLDDELRGPLHRTSLYVKKGSDLKYHYNEEWTYNVSNDDLDVLERAFGKFYVSTESIMKKLKKEYIQIRVGQKNEKGLFDYILYEQDIDQIAMELEPAKSFDEFYNIVINYLWVLTEENLMKVKEVLKTEIYQDYLESFETLRDDVNGISNKRVCRRIQQKTKEAETDMQNTLEKITFWFQRSNESKHNDFDLQFAFDLGLQTVMYMHPEKRFKAIALEPTESDKITGDFLKDFDGLFYNIFDNIYKNATQNTKDGSIEIRYILKWDAKGKVRIYIENDFDCSGNIQNDIEKLDLARDLISSGEYISRVKGEGGTGIPKIYKILMVDLHLSAKLDFGFKESKNIFYMEITV